MHPLANLEGEDSGLLDDVKSNSNFLGLGEGFIACLGNVGTSLSLGEKQFDRGCWIPWLLHASIVILEVSVCDGCIVDLQVFDELACGHWRIL